MSDLNTSTHTDHDRASLDALFHAARTTAERESASLASTESQRELLNNVMGQTTTTSGTTSSGVGAFGRLREAVRFNPIMTMTTIGIAAACVIAANFLLAPAPQNHTAQNHSASVSTNAVNAQTAQNASEEHVTVQPNASVLPSYNRYSPADIRWELPAGATLTPDATLPAKTDDTISSRIDLTGFTPIVATSAQLEKLAILLDGDGMISYFYRLGDKNTMRLTLLPTAGVLYVNDKLKRDTSRVPIFAPRLITNADGTRRIFHLQTDDTDMPEITRGMPKLKGSTTIDITASNPSSSDVTLVPTPGPDGRLKPHQQLRTESVRIIDTVRADGTHYRDTITETREINDDMIPPQAMRQLDSLNRLFGSRNGAHRIEVRVEATANDTSGTSSGISRIATTINPNEIIDSLFTKDGGLQQINTIIQRANIVDISKLIPVRVTNHSDSKTNDLIFWYEPSAALSSILTEGTIPSAVATTTALASVGSIAAFPNPANTTTKLSLNLKENRNVSLNVYSLLGQQLLSVGNYTVSGEKEISIDVSTLQPGVYLVLARTDRGEQFSQRLVVER